MPLFLTFLECATGSFISVGSARISCMLFHLGTLLLLCHWATYDNQEQKLVNYSLTNGRTLRSQVIENWRSGNDCCQGRGENHIFRGPSCALGDFCCCPRLVPKKCEVIGHTASKKTTHTCNNELFYYHPRSLG